jgi:hypothetical protein
VFSFVFSSLFLVAASAADLKSKIYFSVSEHSSLTGESSAAFSFVPETAGSRAAESAPASGFRQNGQTETARAVSFSAFCLMTTSSLIRVTIFVRRIVFIVLSRAIPAPVSFMSPRSGSTRVVRES